jgi:hypothetical protein
MNAPWVLPRNSHPDHPHLLCHSGPIDGQVLSFVPWSDWSSQLRDFRLMRPADYDWVVPRGCIQPHTSPILREPPPPLTPGPPLFPKQIDMDPGSYNLPMGKNHYSILRIG